MRALLVFVVLLAVLAVLDEVARTVTARRLAARIQSTQHLSARPTVTIGGWPFVTQVVRGRYGRVTIASTAPIGQAGITVSDVQVTLRGVVVNTGQALRGTVAALPVASGSGTGLLSYAELDAILARYVPAIGSQLRVTASGSGRARLGGPFGLSLQVTARVVDGKLSVMPDAAELAALPALVRNPVAQALSRSVALPTFPFNVRLVSAELEPDGVHLHATARNSIFPVN